MAEASSSLKRKEPDASDETAAAPGSRGGTTTSGTVGGGGTTTTTPRTGIYQKLRDLKEEIQKVQDNVHEKGEAIKDLQAKRSDVSATALQLVDLQDQLLQLKDQYSELERSFQNGKYYAATSEWWKTGAKSVSLDNKKQWSSFVRTPAQVEKTGFQCRCYNTTNKALSLDDPYKETRDKAPQSQYEVVSSAKARSAASSQKNKSERDLIWPMDIFGNKAETQPIAHLLPAGPVNHKEWIHVAAAAAGMNVEEENDSWFEIMSKVTRGFKPRSKKDRETTRSVRKEPGVGVVHFVSNKIRLASQGELFDGTEPQALLVPVMTAEATRDWRGEPYDAIFLLGFPRGDVEVAVSSIPGKYQNVGLDKEILLGEGGPRDATPEEIECAQKLLVDAFLGLRAMVANLSDKFIDQIYPEGDRKQTEQNKKFKSIREKAQAAECVVPFAVDDNPENRKPVCLLTFGGEGKHPPPDPLLLALKAANVWGRMTKQDLLANGNPYDPNEDMSERDYIAEQAYYEAKFGHWTPNSTTWEELAVGLGQPNGYQPVM